MHNEKRFSFIVNGETYRIIELDKGRYKLDLGFGSVEIVGYFNLLGLIRKLATI